MLVLARKQSERIFIGKTIILTVVKVEGSVVRLEPLRLSHVTALAQAGLDPELWRWIPTPVTTVGS